MFFRPSTQIAMFVAFLILALTFTTSALVFENQDEYEGFIDLIDGSLKGHHDDGHGYNYQRDRHQRQFIVCKERNATQTESRFVRCYREPSLRPACFATYDAFHDEVIQGCYGYQKEMAPDCESEQCTMGVVAKRFGFCCCVGNKCNEEDNFVDQQGKKFEEFSKELRRKQ